MSTTAHASGQSTAVPRPPSAAIAVSTLVKTFRRENGTRITPVDHVDLMVEPGEMVVLLGPSGCGKTTLLRCISGLETPDSGRIEIQGRPVYDSSKRLVTPTEARNISMVFQSYALWPHMTVLANVAYPLKVRKVPKGEIHDAVRRVLEIVGIPELENQYPGQLSGGQQQRVALARAIVPNTEVILFDEPLSNVDAKVREALRLEMTTMRRQLGFSGVYVTHDQEEAMELADRIVVLKNGVIEQAGAPSEVYGRPRTRYVAGFVGTINEVIGTITTVNDDGLNVLLPIGEFRVAFDGESQEVDWAVGDEVRVTWRPESTQTSTQPLPTTENTFMGSVVSSVLSGAFTKDLINIGGTKVRAWRFGRRLHQIGDELSIHVPPALARAYPIGSDPLEQDG